MQPEPRGRSKPLAWPCALALFAGTVAADLATKHAAGAHSAGLEDVFIQITNGRVQ